VNARASIAVALLMSIAGTVGTAAAGGASASQTLPVPVTKASGIEWTEGKNYEVLTTALPAAPAAGKVEVIEFFQYTCPHCYTLEPYLVFWKKLHADVATITRVPVAYRPPQRTLARFYYTLEALGRIDAPDRKDLHHEIFDEFHRIGAPVASLNDDEESFRLQRDFAIASGINAEEFTRIYRSAEVDAKVKRAEELSKAYRITGTPMFVVGGKYKTDMSKVSDVYKLMSLLADLSLQTARSR
jgi:protein dithiol oxidoreductase (disulfide-forming)